MNPTSNPLSGATAPIQLSLDPAAFTATLLPLVGVHKFGWSGEDHVKFVEALLAQLTDDEGNRIEFTEEQQERLRLVFRPNEETQRLVFKRTLAEAGAELDEKTEKTFVILMNMSQTADYLAKINRPGTDTPFIVKERRRGVKKGFFQELVTASDQDTGAPTAEQQPEPTPPAPTPAPASVRKPATKPTPPKK